MLNHKTIGKIRKFLMIQGTHKWNALVRDLTAKLGQLLGFMTLKSYPKITREWAMPNKWTFSVRPIQNILRKYVGNGKGWIDPFAGKYSPAEITNDIEFGLAIYQMDALDFLKTLETNSKDGALFDPPYSVEQCLRKYTPKQKGTAGRAEYWAKCKNEITRILRKDSVVISFAWDSTGMGKATGFDIIEILLVCHGACHNDTICTVEKRTKIQEVFDFK